MSHEHHQNMTQSSCVLLYNDNFTTCMWTKHIHLFSSLCFLNSLIEKASNSYPFSPMTAQVTILVCHFCKSKFALFSSATDYLSVQVHTVKPI